MNSNQSVRQGSMYISTQIKSYFGFCPCCHHRRSHAVLRSGQIAPKTPENRDALPRVRAAGSRFAGRGPPRAAGPPGRWRHGPRRPGPGPPCGDRAARPGAGRVAALPAPRPPRGRVRRLRPFTIHGANTYTWGGGGERRPSGPRPDFRGDRLDLSELVLRVETGSREEP